MHIVLSDLLSQGFVVTSRMRDAVYVSRGADHRVILRDGTVKRGHPQFRGKSRG